MLGEELVVQCEVIVLVAASARIGHVQGMHPRILVVGCEDFVRAMAVGTGREVRVRSDRQPSVFYVDLRFVLVAVVARDRNESVLVSVELCVCVTVFTFEVLVYGALDQPQGDEGSVLVISAVTVRADLGFDLDVLVVELYLIRSGGVREARQAEQQKDGEDPGDAKLAEGRAVIFYDALHGGFSHIRRLAMAT
jgi:hypothetical protein